MEDFTGGVTEVYQLNEVEDNFFDLMCDVSERQTLMCCSIDGAMDARMDNGLYKGHAYTITNVKKVLIDFYPFGASPNVKTLRIYILTLTLLVFYLFYIWIFRADDFSSR